MSVMCLLTMMQYTMLWIIVNCDRFVICTDTLDNVRFCHREIPRSSDCLSPSPSW